MGAVTMSETPKNQNERVLHVSVRALNINLSRILLEIAERKTTGVLHTAGRTRLADANMHQVWQVFNLNGDLINSAKMDDFVESEKTQRLLAGREQGQCHLRVKTARTQPSSKDDERKNSVRQLFSLSDRQQCLKSYHSKETLINY
jgi:hypothetical protein